MAFNQEQLDYLWSQLLGPAATDPGRGMPNYGRYVSNADQISQEKGWDYGQTKGKLRDWRDYSNRTHQLQDLLMGMGYSLQDLGYEDRPDAGQVGLRSAEWAATHGFRPNNFEYDWNRGVKWNTVTSDEHGRGTPRPIDANEYKLHNEALQLRSMGYKSWGQQLQAKKYLQRGQQPPPPEQLSGAPGFDVNELISQVQQSGWKMPDGSQSRLNLGDSGEGGGGGGGYSNLSRYGGGGGGGGYSGYGYSGDTNSPGQSYGGGGGGDASNFYIDPHGAFGKYPEYPADLESALTEQTNQDILTQRMANEKTREGYGLGMPIYQYLLNEVYGPILGTRFTPEQGPPAAGPLLGGGGPGGGMGGPSGGGSIPGGGGGNAPSPNRPAPSEISQIPGQRSPEWDRMGMSAPQTGGPDQGMTGNGYSQLSGDASTEPIPFGPWPPSGGEGGGTASGPTAYPGPYGGGGPTPTPGSPIGPMPPLLSKGSYSGGGGGGGGNSFDPNMNQTWAKFLAPTYNKVSSLTDQQLQEIKRTLPRGGEQDRSVSDAIQNKYSALQSGWQGLVPMALGGISQIGQEMYFQQPNAFTGASGIREGGRQANQGNELGLKQLQSQTQLAKQQYNSDLMGKIGGGLGGLLSNLGK